jgi:uncharacterized protein YbjQ (UPF0145 family)
MLIVTVPEVPGDYDLLGYVLGSGTTLQEAMARLQADATQLAAWGVVGLSFEIAEDTSGVSWVVAYGTAISQPRS